MAVRNNHYYTREISSHTSYPSLVVADVYPHYTSSPMMRRQSSSWSTASSASSNNSPRLSRPSSVSTASSSSTVPRVQLVPHMQSFSFDSALSPSERLAVDNTSFDELDLSSKDFDFEDIFTYGRPPQQKLNRVVEVSTPTRDASREQRQHNKSEGPSGGFSFSHFANPSPGSMGTKDKDRAKLSRARSGIGSLYVKNGVEARRR